MVKLVPLPPCADLLPITQAGVTVTQVAVDVLMSVAPFAGQQDAVSDALKSQTGAGLSLANRRDGPVTWFGHGAWIVWGPVTLDGIAAVTDQSDAWAVVQLQGDAVEAVLARLVPVDLRRSVFADGHVAKTMLGHMSVTITRLSADAFEIMVMRSMAGTLVHDLQVAMRGVAAR